MSQVQDFKRFSQWLIDNQNERIEFLKNLKQEVEELLKQYQQERQHMATLLEEFLFLVRTEREKEVKQFLAEQQAIREEIHNIWVETMKILESHKD